MHQDTLVKAAITLFFVYFFFIKRDRHSMQASTKDMLDQLGFNSDASILKNLIFVTPFLYALRNDLGLAGLFDKLGVTDASAIVNL